MTEQELRDITGGRPFNCGHALFAVALCTGHQSLKSLES